MKGVSLDITFNLVLFPALRLFWFIVVSSKEVFCTISQFIYNDILESFEAKGIFAQLHGPSLAASPRIFFLCRFPSMVNTEHFSSNLFVVGEDEFKNIYAAVSGKHPVDIIIYGIQSRLQDNILQLYHSDSQLRHVLLFHECSLNATSVDLTIGVCTSLRRHRAHIQRISKYKSFEFAQTGRSRTFTKATYFIALSSARNVNSFEVFSPSLEYTETWLCSSKFLTTQLQAAITAVPGVFRFRVYSQDPPLHTELGATDRCCITFGIAESEVHKAADPLASIYAWLSQEVTSLAQQDLQRVIPFFWNIQFREVPTFYDYDTVTFLDIRSCTQEERWRIQAILIDMEIPYYVQKRLLLVIYAEGIELENFRLRTFQEQIKIPFGREEGSLQCSFAAGANNDIWTVDIHTTGSDRHEAFQIEDDGSLMMRDGLVDTDLCDELQKVLGATQIRPAMVHVRDKGHQKVVAFIASPDLLPRIPDIFVDHKGQKRIVHYKQPDVHTTERTSNIYVKETKTDHHVGAHNKGLCQGARLSGFFPLPGNSMSRRRFGQLQVFSFEIGSRDISVDILDEIVPICLIEAELSIQEASNLFDILMRQKHLLDHHTIFLECTASKPPPYQHNNEVITMLPEHECIVHCQIERGQKLHVLQPRFERGKVSKCVSNALELSVYVRSNLLLFLPGQIEVHDIFESAPIGRILSVWHNDQRSSKIHTALPTTAKIMTKTANTPSKFDQSAKGDNHFTVEVCDSKQSPTRSVPSSSDHNQDAVSPLPTEIDATGTTSQEDGSSPKHTIEPLSPHHSPVAKDVSQGNSAISLLKDALGKSQVTSQENHANPELFLQEPNFVQVPVTPDKECTFDTQNTLTELNVKMQVDESGGSHAADKDASTVFTCNLENLHRSLTTNTGASLKPESLKEDAIIPASLEEGPSGNEASQRSSYSALVEQVYQDLQQQLDDAKAKVPECKVHLSKRPNASEEVLAKKSPPGKKPGESRQKLPRKPASKAAPKRGDGLSHCLAKQKINAQHASCGAASKNSANEVLRNKRRQAHLHSFRQMVSRDVSLQNMDFQEEDFQRAVSLYENLNATACFYTAALRIISKANWDKQVNFENHIGHQAMVAIAKGWTCASRLPNDDFDHYHLALAMSTLPKDTHMVLLRTYEAIVAIIPPPFHHLQSLIYLSKLLQIY